MAQSPREALRSLWLGARLFIFCSPPTRSCGRSSPALSTTQHAGVHRVHHLLHPRRRRRRPTAAGPTAISARLARGGQEAEASTVAAHRRWRRRAVERRHKALPRAAAERADRRRSRRFKDSTHAKTVPATLATSTICTRGRTTAPSSTRSCSSGRSRTEWKRRRAAPAHLARQGLHRPERDRGEPDVPARLPLGLPLIFVLAGPTYPSRLCGASSSYSYGRVGGARRRSRWRTCAAARCNPSSRNSTRARPSISAKDRQHLAVIESGFGDLLPFNKVIKTIMADAAMKDAVRPEDLDNADNTYSI